MRNRLLTGRVLGDVIVAERIALGGMAEIYAGTRAGAPIVVKRIHPHLAHEPEFVAMFEDEIAITAHLRHPGIVTVLDVLREPDEVLLVLERVDGVDVRAALLDAEREGRAIDLAAALACVQGVAAALAHVHAAVDASGAPLAIVHRDISPTNVMARAAGGVCVLDFGVARAAARVAHTTGSITKGKAAYLSPEQAGLEPVGAASDVYQLGLVLFELVTGRRALRGRSPLELMRAAASPEHPPLSSLRRDVPPEIDAVALAMLRSEPASRPTAGEVAEQLAAYTDAPSLAAMVASQRDATHDERARRDRALELAAGIEWSPDDTEPLRR